MSFNQYLEANAHFWDQLTPQSTRPPEDAILVDLMTMHPGYFIGNALVAKYLQRILNKQVIGILRGRNDEKARSWAESFRLDKLVYLEDAGNISASLPLPDEFSDTDPGKRRKALLNYTYQGVPLGSLAYDLYLRETGLGTLNDIDQGVLSRLHQAINNFSFFSSAIKAHSVTHTVQGHIVYSTYGALARAAVHNGCKVFARKFAAGPFTLRCYSDLNEIKNHEFRFPVDEFEDYFLRFGEQLARQGAQLLEQRTSGLAVHGDRSNAEAYGAHKAEYLPAEIQEKLALAPDKPNVCIMSHVFADAPHSFEWMLYDDYYEWLIQTLEIIKDIDDVNWLIKSHPDNLHYNSRHSTADACSAYTERYPHIKLLPNEINTASLFHLVNAIVTVSGTAGIEFTCKGIPCLNAGVSTYTGLGFTIDPENEGEYRTALKTIGFEPKLAPEQQKRAQAFAQLYFSQTRVKSCFIPDMPGTFWVPLNEEEIFAKAKSALETYTIDDDPVYAALTRQINQNKPHIMNLLSHSNSSRPHV